MWEVIRGLSPVVPDFVILHLGWPPKVGDFRFATKDYHPKKCSAHHFPGRQGLTECHESLTPLSGPL